MIQFDNLFAQLLKDQLRKVDGVEQRANMNMEYLKNVIVKFLETPDVERDVGGNEWRRCDQYHITHTAAHICASQKFVVVFQQLLHLDDQEIARIKMALTNKQVGGWLF